MTIVLTIVGFIIFIYSIILHEIAHGWVADRLGDPTARLMGRLTLNPIPHIDPIMSVLVPLFLRFSGAGIIFGAAKPVPIDPYNLREPRKDMGLIGLAGPATNLLLAGIFALIAHLLFAFAPIPILIQLLANAAIINIVLAVFNLIPIPPLDGGRVLSAILPANYANALASLERFGLLIIMFLFLFPNPILPLQSIISRITFTIFGFIFPGIS
ncbi:MAG: site-2 protease family protein [Patescibacteria group bacterium]|jgi:Zn-dependent protease